ncbi:MAG: DUF2914 domain-containing protein [Gammaproteobacteria bacterium]|nr:DUF2914 domain-containing protein [Gammaproteobacteria bacterium]
MKLKIQVQITSSLSDTSVTKAPIDWRKVIFFLFMVLSPLGGWLAIQSLPLSKHQPDLISPVESMALSPVIKEVLNVDDEEDTLVKQQPIQVEVSFKPVELIEEKPVLQAQVVQPEPVILDSVRLDNITRMALTSAIKDHEPSDELGHQLNAEKAQVLYFFTEVSGLAGQQISHRWTLNNRVMATVNLNVGGDRWRTYSSKNVTEQMLGQWLVEVINGQGLVISRYKFDYHH